MASKKKTAKNPRIPKGEDGFVPVEALQARHNSRSVAAKMVDEKKDAQKIYPQTLTPAEAQSWWKRPGRSDISGIDTKAPPNTVPRSSRGSSKGTSKGTSKAKGESKDSGKTSTPDKKSGKAKVKETNKTKTTSEKPKKSKASKETSKKSEAPKPSVSSSTEEALRKKGYDMDVTTSEAPGMRMIVLSPKRTPAPTYSNAPSGFEGPLLSSDEILAMFAEPVQLYDVARGRKLAMSITKKGGMFSTHGSFLPFPGGQITASPSAFVCDGKYIGITDNGQSYWFWIRSETGSTKVEVEKPKPKAVSPKVEKTEKKPSALEAIQEPDDFEDIDKKKRRRKNKRRTSRTEYSASYYAKLPWKDDPQRASREFMDAMMAEGEEIEDAAAYLKDSDYGEVANNDRWKYDSREINRTYRRLQWDRYKMENPEYAYNQKPKKRWSFGRSKVKGGRKRRDLR